MRTSRSLLMLSMCWLSIAAAQDARCAELDIAGHKLLLDGNPFDMWGIRTASASQTQVLTDHLIAQLDDYVARGVNSLSVY